MSVKKLIDERTATHGPYEETANLCWNFMQYLQRGPGYKRLAEATPFFSHTLYMICLKLVRICFGNPYEPDHWKDIQGYCQLVLERLEELGKK